MASDLIDSDKLIINAAITGMIPTKTDTPYMPTTVGEIIADARRCYDAGATIIHVHARDEMGKPSCNATLYRQIISGIRSLCPGLLISATTSGRLHGEFHQRAASLDAMPDFGSLTLGSMNFPKQVSTNRPDMIQQLATAMNQRNIVPELECFEIGMIDYARDYLIPKGFLRNPLYFNLLLGSLGTMAATPVNLTNMVNALPDGATWAAAGIGRFQFDVNCMAIQMGGHIRIGLEDNLYYDTKKTELATNAGLIDRIVKFARSAGRDIASPKETRRIIGIYSKSTQTNLVAQS